MDELEKLKKEWEREGLSGLEIEKNFQVLKKIYIGQHIRDEGILQQDFAGQYKQIKHLLNKGLIRENNWYKHNLFLTTEIGSIVAKEYLEKEMEKKKAKFLHVLDNIPLNLLQFLLYDYFAIKLVYPCNIKDEYFSDWREPLFKDPKILRWRDTILKRLEELGFCVKTCMYVSTRGGEVRELCYVISPEISEKVLEIKKAIQGGLEWEIKKKLVMFLFFQRILPFIKLEEKNEEVVNQYRQEIWSRMEELNLIQEEEEIKTIINELAEKGITSEYRGFFAKDLPFEVKDEIGYITSLKEKLVFPVISLLLEEVKGEELETFKREIPSGLLSKKEFLSFYNELGEFEIKVRKFIASKLGENLEKIKENKKLKDIKERLNKWRGEEKRLVGYSEEPLINFATFEDYKKLILLNWEYFKKYFNSKDEATLPLSIINILARRPLAHFRILTKERIELARRCMKSFLEKIKGEESV